MSAPYTADRELLGAIISDYTGMVKTGEGIAAIGEKTLPYDEYTSDDVTIRYYLEGNQVYGIEIKTENHHNTLVITDFSDTVPAEVFDLPEDYTLKEIELPSAEEQREEARKRMEDIKNEMLYNPEIRIESLGDSSDITAEIGGSLKTPGADEIKVLVNDSPLQFDVPPQIVNGRILVPVRNIFEIMGAEIKWDDSTKTIIAANGDTTVIMTVGGASALVNGAAAVLDQPSIIVDNRTLAPLRFVAEAFGGMVEWDSTTQTVSISSQ